VTSRAPPTPERTAWHVLFERLVIQRAPSSIEVRTEVPVGRSRPQFDLLLLRRRFGPRVDRRAQVLRGLWRHVGEAMVLEFKSISRPLRPGDLLRLFGYGAHFASETMPRTASRLSLGLVVASITPTLGRELRVLGGSLPGRQGGYARVRLKPFDLVLAVVDEVALTERDELLGAFGHGELSSVRSKLWWQKETGRAMSILKDLPGHDRVLAKFLAKLSPEERLAGLAPEQRLAGLAPEQRLAGLAPEQRLAGLRDADLRIVLDTLGRRFGSTPATAGMRSRSKRRASARGKATRHPH
jgi:hypothetical protein